MRKIDKIDKIDKTEKERSLHALGYRYIAACDEVGRGPLAGPVVCAAVVMPIEEELLIEGIDDSKKLSESKREKLDVLIRERAIDYAVCEVDNDVIDEINILQATRLCMKNAIERLKIKPDYVVTDGNMTLDISVPQESVVHGDALCYSIGAASIVAKVYRDRLMAQFAEEFPYYAFEKNKGYGTKAHIQGIKEHGPCRIHRRTFITKI